MKVFNVKENIDTTGECIVGAEETGSHACYLIYGTMTPGEKERPFKPGAGHEELLLVIRGRLQVSGHVTGTLTEGQAIHLKGDETCRLENISGTDAVYVISGGHSEGGHH
jgi:redox-sensitive bicupin YhaK (pirin superfamily)